MSERALLIVLLAFFFAVFGCSSGGGANIVAPEEPSYEPAGTDSHHLWGYWQFTADPEAGTLDITTLRFADMHLNALKFLEPPPYIYLTLEGPPQFNGGVVDVNIGLRHPFLGQDKYTGFDACGILITNGSVTGFSDSNLRMAGEGDTHLLNPDGYSRWWNPSEFPVNDGTMFSYQDGLLGTPYSSAGYNSTINGYKYFCDDLDDPNDPLDEVTIENRGMFSAGQKNVRHYTIKIGDSGLVFNYAVDACWKSPTGSPPWDVPDDFGPNANRPEAWRISVTELENTLYNDGIEFGGDISLSIDVYDHFDADANLVRIEAPGEIPMTETGIAIGGGDGYSTYHIDINDCIPAASGGLDLLITVESDVSGYGGNLPGEPISAYFIHTTDVDDEPPATDPWSDEFTIPSALGRTPAMCQSPSGRVVAGWSSDPGVYWSEFTFPDSWAEPGVVELEYWQPYPPPAKWVDVDSIRVSIEPGYSGDEIYLNSLEYVGLTDVNGTMFEYGNGIVYKWEGGTEWDKWNTGVTQLCTHYYNDFEGKHHELCGSYASYGHPMHIQWTEWKQEYADYFQDYYDDYNISEYGYSRCWDEDSNGYTYVTFEGDRMKGVYLEKIDYRYIKIAIQYLPSTGGSDHSTHTIDEGDNDYLDSPVVAIDSSDRVHVAYRRYIDATGEWQVVYRWSDDGKSWSSENETIVWAGADQPGWRYISIDVDTQDRIHLTFMLGGDIWYTRSSDGVNWLDLEYVNESIFGLDGVGDHQPWMFVDADDQVHVIWSRQVVYPGVEYGAIRHRWRKPLP